MNVTRRYKVVNKFKYGGEILQPGDDFHPAGGRWDSNLIANPKLIEVIETIDGGDEFSALTVRELRGKLKDAGLPVYGNKAQLIARLVQGV